MKSERSATTAHDPTATIAQLRSEHERLEARLLELDRNVYLTPDEQFERKRLQKMKLRAKDEIQQLTGKLS